MLNNIKQLISDLQCPSITSIPRDWNQLTNMLAVQQKISPTLPLFHQGMEKPKLLMRGVVSHGFYF